MVSIQIYVIIVKIQIKNLYSKTEHRMSQQLGSEMH